MDSALLGVGMNEDARESETKVLECVPRCAGDHLLDGYRPTGRIDIYAVPVGTAVPPGADYEDDSGSAGFPRGTHSPVSGPVAGPDPCGIHVSARTDPAPAVASEKSWAEGQSTRRCGSETTVGSKHPGHGGAARCGQTPGR